MAALATYSPVIALADDAREQALTSAAARLDERFPGRDVLDVTIVTRGIRADRLPR